MMLFKEKWTQVSSLFRKHQGHPEHKQLIDLKKGLKALELSLDQSEKQGRSKTRASIN